MEVEKNRSNKIMKVSIISFCALLSIYFIFFINTMSVSAKTVKEKKITPEVYTLTLQEKGGVKELINGADIGLKYSSETPKVITYDDELLKACISKLSCLDSNKIFKSQNASFIYQDNGYLISREVYGNEINKTILYEYVVKAIQNGDTELNLEAINCYESPKFVTSSSEVAYAKENLNKYVSAKITYTFAGLTQYLDGSVIKNWIGVDGNFQVTIDEAKVRAYVDTLASKYSSSLGTDIKVSGGYDGNNHSWIIDSSEETKALIENIKNGQTITKSPIYAQTSAASYFSNVGDTYVEIDMDKQHLWYYKDGYLVVEGDVVTGNVSDGCSTPAGIYHLRSKEKDSVLRGPGYECPVSFWMPFVNQIGLHDASWRAEFGGEIYKTDGSHGCVNAPYYVAKAVYDNINPGDAIICHY
ncbi:MAG: L,D-transpeptidase/peptidoglycan binding protein [Clostridium sp.]|uniref:L,D-transpeptidase family protein n=1 Tax=Clostridium sp. TaxID=1506 RepID=UPI0025BE3929|nr:L,D-transpeptidase family protein [Clostridium sp.]MCE5222415.1 L,D-transpeptidase/peptidoglycan binding protein [Clostridium sp.]